MTCDGQCGCGITPKCPIGKTSICPQCPTGKTQTCDNGVCGCQSTCTPTDLSKCTSCPGRTSAGTGFPSCDNNSRCNCSGKCTTKDYNCSSSNCLKNGKIDSGGAECINGICLCPSIYAFCAADSDCSSTKCSNGKVGCSNNQCVCRTLANSMRCDQDGDCYKCGHGIQPPTCKANVETMYCVNNQCMCQPPTTIVNYLVASRDTYANANANPVGTQQNLACEPNGGILMCWGFIDGTTNSRQCSNNWNYKTFPNINY